MTKQKLYVSGTHCNACKLMIEDIISEQKGVQQVSVDLSEQSVTVEGDIDANKDALIQQWAEKLKKHGYELFVERPEISGKKPVKISAVLLGTGILALFFIFQRMGIVDLGFEGSLTPWTALIIGGIASVSTCLAVVGGLILSFSANISRDVTSTKPFTLFHIGRLLGFTALGGGLGFIGDAIEINYTISSILGIIVSLIMIVLGANLLGLLRKNGGIQITLPASIFKRFKKIENGFFAPFIVGIGTFFLPCGFTQSMQFAALSSGSFISGSLIMGAFAIGTLPMLAALSFGSYRFSKTRYATTFFQAAGVMVMGLGIFAFLSALAGLGIIRPLFNI
jgi:sulfite exporter TauE/SafE/copper chaperone CopZ